MIECQRDFNLVFNHIKQGLPWIFWRYNLYHLRKSVYFLFSS